MGNFAADSSPIPTVGIAAACSSGPYTSKELSLRKEAGLRQRPRPPAGLRTQILSPWYQTPPQQAPTCRRSLPRHSEEVAAHSLLECPWMPPATGTSLPLKVGHSSALRKLCLGASPHAAPHTGCASCATASKLSIQGLIWSILRVGVFSTPVVGAAEPVYTSRPSLVLTDPPMNHPQTQPCIHTATHIPPPLCQPSIHPSLIPSVTTASVTTAPPAWASCVPAGPRAVRGGSNELPSS